MGQVSTTERDGLVHGLEEVTYHSGPELSSTGAKTILRSPAHYRWEQQHRTEKAAFDFGHAVHALVLGVGMDIEVIPGPWTTKAAKQDVATARAAGCVPIKPEDWQRAKTAAAAVREHPIAGPLFSAGEPEVSMFWTDETTGVRCRGRLDWLRTAGRLLTVDLKTCQDANPSAFGRIAAKFGYSLQQRWYREGYAATTGGEMPPLLFVLVETEPPHAVSVVQLDDEADQVGAALASRARERYRDCTESGSWPAYAEDVHVASLPRWYVTDAEEVA